MKLGVLVYLEDNKGRILMIHREKEDEHKGLWLAPGGKVESNEAPHETAIREMQEETGLIIRNPEKKFSDFNSDNANLLEMVKCGPNLVLDLKIDFLKNLRSGTRLCRVYGSFRLP